MSEKDNNQCSLSQVCIKSITGPLWRAHYNSKKTIETIKEDFKNLIPIFVIGKTNGTRYKFAYTNIRYWENKWDAL